MPGPLAQRPFGVPSHSAGLNGAAHTVHPCTGWARLTIQVNRPLPNRLLGASKRAKHPTTFRMGYRVPLLIGYLSELVPLMGRNFLAMSQAPRKEIE